MVLEVLVPALLLSSGEHISEGMKMMVEDKVWRFAWPLASQGLLVPGITLGPFPSAGSNPTGVKSGLEPMRKCLRSVEVLCGSAATVLLREHSGTSRKTLGICGCACEKPGPPRRPPLAVLCCHRVATLAFVCVTGFVERTFR